MGLACRQSRLRPAIVRSVLDATPRGASDYTLIVPAELPAEQRAVLVAHELEGRSFKEIAAETGVSVNTLLSRKRYAVLRLRKRLQSIYDEFDDSMRI